MGGVCKQWWGLEVASRAYNKRVQSWQQAEDENYIWSSEKNIDHMQELQSCMAEHDRIELAFQKLTRSEEALRQVEFSAVMTEQETLEKGSLFADAQADESPRLDAYYFDDKVDEGDIIQGNVITEESALLQDSLFVSEEVDEELRLGAIVDKEASGSSETTPSERIEDCLQLSDDKVFEGIAVDNVNETVKVNMRCGSKPLQATAGSNGVESADAGNKTQGNKWLQGNLLHYSELKEDLVELVKVYKEQINAAQYNLKDAWGDAYIKAIVNIKWFKKELQKLRRRHNGACKAYDNVVKRLAVSNRSKPMQVFPSKQRKHRARTVRSVGTQTLPCYDGKIVKSMAAHQVMVHQPYKGKSRAAKGGRLSGQSYQYNNTHGNIVWRDISNHRVESRSAKSAWACEQYRFSSKGDNIKTRSRPSLV